jgi:hypothetical protein
MYLNVSFTLNSAGGGVVLISPKGDQLLYVIRLHFHATNNVAEYEALINILRFTVELGVLRLYIHGDFELIINQVMGESNYHDSCMVLSFTISSGETMRQLMPSPSSGQAANCLLWACSLKICSCPPSSLRRIFQYPHPGPSQMKTALYRYQEPCWDRTTQLQN